MVPHPRPGVSLPPLKTSTPRRVPTPHKENFRSGRGAPPPHRGIFRPDPDPLLPTKGDRGAPRLTMGSSTSDRTALSPRGSHFLPLHPPGPHAWPAPPAPRSPPPSPPRRLRPTRRDPRVARLPPRRPPAPAVRPGYLHSLGFGDLSGASPLPPADTLFPLYRPRRNFRWRPGNPAIAVPEVAWPGVRNPEVGGGPSPEKGGPAGSLGPRPVTQPAVTPRMQTVARGTVAAATRAPRRRGGLSVSISRKFPRPAPGPPSGGSCVSTTSPGSRGGVLNDP